MSISAEPLPFEEVLEAVDRLTLDEQEDLAAIIRRRLAERGRKQLAQDVHEACQEFAAGGCRPMTASELMDEILPRVRALWRIDKLRLIQLLAEDLAEAEESPPFATGQTYPLWSPDRAYDTAAVLLRELEAERTRL